MVQASFEAVASFEVVASREVVGLSLGVLLPLRLLLPSRPLLPVRSWACLWLMTWLLCFCARTAGLLPLASCRKALCGQRVPVRGLAKTNPCGLDAGCLWGGFVLAPFSL